MIRTLAEIRADRTPLAFALLSEAAPETALSASVADQDGKMHTRVGVDGSDGATGLSGGRGVSELGDLIVNHDPFTGPLRFDGFGDQDELTSFRHLDAPRGELIELRAIVAKVETDQCGCLGGPLSIEWVQGRGLIGDSCTSTRPPHPTCIDVTAIDQTVRSAWTCGPDCPKEA